MSIKIPKQEQLKILQAVLANVPYEYEKITKKKEKEQLKNLEKTFK